MRATRVRFRKSRRHCVSWCRVRYRAPVADPNRAAMSHIDTGTSSNSAAAPCAVTTNVISEQRTGRCNQQCRYADCCKKLGYPHHDALLVRGAQPGPTAFPLLFKIGARMVFHAYLGRYPPE